MKRTSLNFFVIGFMALAFCTTTSFAMDFLGPPAAELSQGQWSAGVDFSHSRTDLKFYEGRYTDFTGPSTKESPFKIPHFKTDTLTANLGYGITNNVEAFLRLGALTTENTEGHVLSGSGKYSGDTGFDIGFGTKATFWQEDKLSMGGIFQFSWAKPDGDIKINYGEGDIWSYNTDLKLMEIQIAIGATYQLIDWAKIYGGPFLHYIDGSIIATGHSILDPALGKERYTYDITQANYFGGFIGTQIEIIKNIPFNFEWQHTATDDAIAMNMTLKF
jgi:hypothetical protein